MRWRQKFCLLYSSFLIWLPPLFSPVIVFAAIIFPPCEVWAEQDTLRATNAVEFSARLIWNIDGHAAKAQLFVKHDRYRIEHMGGVRTELGYAGVTIVRLDEQKVWYIISQRRMVVSVPLTSEYLLPFSVTLEGETSRTLIGDSLVSGHAAVLYEVVVQNQSGQREQFFEWVDPERDVLLKLVSQDRDWFVEYGHVVLSSQPDYYFNPPLGYRKIEAQEAFIPRG